MIGWHTLYKRSHMRPISHTWQEIPDSNLLHLPPRSKKCACWWELTDTAIVSLLHVFLSTSTLQICCSLIHLWGLGSLRQMMTCCCVLFWRTSEPLFPWNASKRFPNVTHSFLTYWGDPVLYLLDLPQIGWISIIYPEYNLIFIKWGGTGIQLLPVQVFGVRFFADLVDWCF